MSKPKFNIGDVIIHIHKGDLSGCSVPILIYKITEVQAFNYEATYIAADGITYYQYKISRSYIEEYYVKA